MVKAGWAMAAALRACSLGAMLALGAGLASARAEGPEAYSVEVKDVTAKVGETAIMKARLKIRDGLKVMDVYRNRLSDLSSFDNGVEFEKPLVRAETDDGDLVFSIPLHPTQPGRHPINGLFRVAYISGPGEMSVVSVKLIASVTGTN